MSLITSGFDLICSLSIKYCTHHVLPWHWPLLFLMLSLNNIIFLINLENKIILKKFRYISILYNFAKAFEIFVYERIMMKISSINFTNQRDFEWKWIVCNLAVIKQFKTNVVVQKLLNFHTIFLLWELFSLVGSE